MNRLPALQIYPGDYMRLPVAGCSLTAQGLWLRLRFLMHDSERYGYLCVNGLPYPHEHLARKCGASLDEFKALLAELVSVGALDRTQDDILFCSRMVRDGEERAKTTERKRKERHGDVTAMSRNGHGDVTPESQRSSMSINLPTEGTDKPPDLWTFSVTVLSRNGDSEKSIRSLIGRKIKEYGEPSVIDALAKTAAKKAAQPKEYFLGVLGNIRKKGAPPKMLV